MKGLGSIRMRILLVDLCWGLVAVLLFASRFGYSFATGDQDEILPFLYSLLDPTLYVNDWFVQSQLASFSVRTYFVWLLAGISSLVPAAWAVWLLFLVLALWIALMVLRLARRLTGSQAAAVVALLVAVVGTHKWTLGGNELLYTMLVPEMAAWALVLPSLLLFLDRRHVLAAVLLGMACWFQLLAGLLTAGVLVVLRAFDGQESFKRRMVQVVVFGAAFTAAALPALIPDGPCSNSSRSQEPIIDTSSTFSPHFATRSTISPSHSVPSPGSSSRCCLREDPQACSSSERGFRRPECRSRCASPPSPSSCA
jgi:hypothetical protein